MAKRSTKRTVKVTKTNNQNEIIVTICLDEGLTQDPLESTSFYSTVEPFWTTFNGRTLGISAMSKLHLVNAIKWCIRQSPTAVKDGYTIREWCDLLVNELGNR